jgi:hypothetical protein
LGEHELAHLASVQEQRRQHGLSDTPLGRAAALRLTFEQARHTLSYREPDGAELLNHRFWRGESVVRLSQRLHVSESTLYAQQEQALCAFAQTLWMMEQATHEAAETRRRYMTRHIPAQTYSRFVGRTEVLDQLRQALSDPGGPWLISIEGLGGIGKTALAHHAVNEAAVDSAYNDIIWVSAQKERFTAWSGIATVSADAAAVTQESLLRELAQELGRIDLAQKPPSRWQKQLYTMLRERPYLIVIDSLDMVPDADAFVSRLWPAANPTRFLFTGRISLCDHTRAYCLSLAELSEAESLDLMRHEAEQRGICRLGQLGDETWRHLYAATGGHPLAIALLVGHARNLPLERATSRLRRAQSGTVRELYAFIYQSVWERISPATRQLLLSLSGASPEGEPWEQMLEKSGLSQKALAPAVQEAVRASLLAIDGASEKRYAVHQLTRNFLVSGLADPTGWNDPATSAQS